MSSKINIERIGKITIVCAFIALLFSQTSIAQFNKCKINGKTVYTDKACPNNTEESLDLSKSNFSTTPALAPSTIRIFNTATRSSSSSRTNSPGWLHDKSGYEKALKISVKKRAPLFIYGYTDWCGYCKKAISFLRSNGISFQQYDIEKNKKASARMKALGGSGGVPDPPGLRHRVRGGPHPACGQGAERSHRRRLGAR